MGTEAAASSRRRRMSLLVAAVCASTVTLATAALVHFAPGGAEPDTDDTSAAAVGPAQSGAQGSAGTEGAAGQASSTYAPGNGPGTPNQTASGGTAKPPTVLDGWTVTVYYTAVEQFHSGATTQVKGCQTVDCSNGNADLGRYPKSFVEAVRNEGTGRTNAGRYLNWSEDVGYWLDGVPRDSFGGTLRPFESAAADAKVLARGTSFTLRTCGRQEDGSALDQRICDRLSAANWTIADEFTTGLGGARHVDLYIGEQTGPNFTDSEWYCTQVGVQLAVR